MKKTNRSRSTGRLFLSVLVLLLFLGALAAWAQEGEGSGGAKVPSSTCLSGMKWTGGNEGSPEMHPGGDCISCHARGEGPRFLAAGTVYQQLDEPNDCYGVKGVVVQVTDAKNKVYKMTSNASGNFNVRRGGPITFPIRVKLFFNGRESAMATPQMTANCAACHTAAGANGAPGRVVAP